MQIILNGSEFELKEEMTISALLVSLEQKEQEVIVECNLAIIAKDKYDTTKIQRNDIIEILRFVGGG